MISPNGLALAAAAEGLPNALDWHIKDIEDYPDAWTSKRALEKLATFIDYHGAPAAFAQWLADHPGEFQYESGRQRYVLGQ